MRSGFISIDFRTLLKTCKDDYLISFQAYFSLAAFPHTWHVIIPHPFRFLKNIGLILIGKKTWVSYHPLDPMISSLPALASGVLHPAYPADQIDITRRLQHIHYVYARDYHWTTDLSILVAQIRKTGLNNSGYGQ
jgi:hypothetical protein